MLPLLLLLELLQESQGTWNDRDRADGVCGLGGSHRDTTFRSVGCGAVDGQGSIQEVDVRPLKSQTFAPPKPGGKQNLKNTTELKITGQKSIEEADGFLFCQGIHIPFGDFRCVYLLHGVLGDDVLPLRITENQVQHIVNGIRLLSFPQLLTKCLPFLALSE